eukprot:m.112615 g.112615  ORF g.112615 m.112615 type:complete len:184 (+) comp14094_c1_seq4:1006-1557(+)
MLNENLKKALQEEFKPKGIVAWSGCCRWGCTGSYDEDDHEWRENVSRDQGIFYIRLHLDGMNYRPDPESCWAYYQDFDYLTKNWNQERRFCEKFCEILGLSVGEYVIRQPTNSATAVCITFLKPLTLDPFPSRDEDEDEDEQQKKKLKPNEKETLEKEDDKAKENKEQEKEEKGDSDAKPDAE